MTLAPFSLRYEHLELAMGVGPERPRLSWLVRGVDAQLAYELETTLRGERWHSGRIDSSESSLVDYLGPLPAGGERITWRVRVWTAAGPSAWSDDAWWERGLEREQWRAAWISAQPIDEPAPGSRPTTLFRVEFEAADPVIRARLHITAHGIYEAHLNGLRVGDAELTPGYTEYADRLQVQVYDVTEQLRAGATNELVVEVSDGWYRGQVGLFRSADQWGDQTGLLAQLMIENDDGETHDVAPTVIATDGAWRARRTTHLADLIEGETIDLRAESRDPWADVVVAGGELGPLVAPDAPPVRRAQQLEPVGIRARGTDWIVDFGQNIAGWLRLRDLGARDNVVTLTFGEELGPDGDVTQHNLKPNITPLGVKREAGQIDTLISDGDRSRPVETRHSTHGFRYVRISGLDHEPQPSDLAAIVVHSDLRRTGTFACSDERINRLHEAAVWSFRGNAIDIPTDCPVRERAGWTGDWQIYLPTAAYLFDVAGFSVKWLNDLAAGQWPNGVIANMAPAPRSEVAEGMFADANGSAGWGDACVIVPWELYQAYCDVRVLERFLPMMRRWVAFVRGAAEGARHPDRAARSAEALPHERYLWDTGFHWGEWLEPMPFGVDVDFGALMVADKGDVATAFYRRSTQLLSWALAAVGQDAAAADYAELSERVRQAWQREFLDEAGAVRPPTQANCVRALTFDLVEPQARASVAAQLAALVRDNGTHLSTGFLATPDLLPALADNGYSDLAFELLQQDTWPSWLGMIDQGATTMWERWEGWQPDGLPHESHNHFSKGAVISFLHRSVAGIRPRLDSPGYRRFEVRPLLGGGITSATGRLDSPYGRIESSWRREGARFSIDVTVPSGTSCTLTLPEGSVHELGAGIHSFDVAV